MSSSHILGVGSTEPRRRWTLARVLKGSPRSLRVMAPPPLLYAYHTLGAFRHHLWCLSTPPQCGIPTFTVGTCSHDVKIKTSKIIKNHTHYCVMKTAFAHTLSSHFVIIIIFFAHSFFFVIHYLNDFVIHNHFL